MKTDEGLSGAQGINFSSGSLGDPGNKSVIVANSFARPNTGIHDCTETRTNKVQPGRLADENILKKNK